MRCNIDIVQARYSARILETAHELSAMGPMMRPPTQRDDTDDPTPDKAEQGRLSTIGANAMIGLDDRRDLHQRGGKYEG